MEDTTTNAGKEQHEEEEEEGPPLFREVLEAYGGGYGPGEGGKAAAYVCFNNTCSRPVHAPEELRARLG